LIALHRTLLHEHHDFFLASQHPRASPAVRRLLAKYDMPARVWRHGIPSFLALLNHSPPINRGRQIGSHESVYHVFCVPTRRQRQPSASAGSQRLGCLSLRWRGSSLLPLGFIWIGF
jgi:hypothetical protein